MKPAELYIPHHIDVSNMEGHNLYLLTADDESLLRDKLFTFNRNQNVKVTIECMLTKLCPPHFCSNCIAIKGEACGQIRKRYLIAKVERKLSDSLLVDLCFLFQQKKCKEVGDNLTIFKEYIVHTEC